MKRSANISGDLNHRYILGRTWGVGAHMGFIGLNPSTADADIDDPTIRRLIGFAKSRSMAGLMVANLYSFRATDPKKLRGLANGGVGAYTDRYIDEVIARCDVVLCGWGAVHRSHQARADEIRGRVSRAGKAWCLGFTKHGEPRHPLYVRADSPFFRIVAEA